MTSLPQLFAAGRKATTLHFRQRVVEDMLSIVGPALEQFIRNRVPHSAVEDVLQETLLAVALGFERCRAGSVPEIWQWCYRIARFKIADHWRKAGPQTVSLDLAEVRRAVEAAVRIEPADRTEAEDLDYALALLDRAKPPCVGYLWEAYALELSYAEMGRLHGKRADAMRMQVRRCLELARQLVAQKVMVNDE